MFPYFKTTICKSHLHQIKITESWFADSATIYVTIGDYDAFTHSARCSVEVAAQFHFIVSVQKNKRAIVSNHCIPAAISHNTDLNSSPVSVLTYIGVQITYVVAE